MEKSRHSDPSLSAKGSKVAAGSSLASASHGTPTQKKNDYSQPDHPASQGAGDVSINRHALVVDNCLDANLRMDKSIPPASSSSEESTSWTQEKKVNTPIPVTEEKVPADHKQEQGPEEEDIQDLLEKAVSLTDKLNTTTKAEFCSTCDERGQAEIYQRLSRYYSKALEVFAVITNYQDILIRK